MEIKLDVKRLVEFLTISTLNGKFESVVLNFKDDGVHINSKDESNLVMHVGFLTKESFDNYKYLDKPIGLRNSKMLIGVLRTFSGIVNINITDDLFTIYNENKTASLKTANITYLDNNYLPEIPKVFDIFDSGVKLNSDIFKNGVKNISVVSGDDIEVRVEKGVISIQAGDKLGDRITEKMNCDYRDTFSKFNGQLLKSIVDVIPGEVTMSIYDNDKNKGIPMQLKYDTENYKGRILIGDNVSDEEINEQKVVNVEEPKIIVGKVEKDGSKKVTTDTTIEDLTDEEKLSDEDLL